MGQAYNEASRTDVVASAPALTRTHPSEKGQAMAEVNSTHRHSSFIDMTGKRFGRLVAVREVGRTANRTPLWEFRCDCGNVIVRQGSCVRSGAVRSCRCLQRELTVARLTKHGESRSKEYCAWRNAIYRCYNPLDSNFKNYGARGIRVCKKWRESFTAFLADMGRAPSSAHTLDRINNDGPYAPGNCRWVPHRDQAANKRTNHRVTWQGLTLSLSGWMRRTGIDQMTIRARLDRGWTIKDALTRPIRSHRPYRKL